jgi:hypothetical protein
MSFSIIISLLVLSDNSILLILIRISHSKPFRHIIKATKIKSLTTFISICFPVISITSYQCQYMSTQFSGGRDVITAAYHSHSYISASWIIIGDWQINTISEL